MLHYSRVTWLAVILMTSFVQAGTNSVIFSQFVGSTTVATPKIPSNPDSSRALVASLTGCTNVLNAVPILTDTPKSQSVLLQSNNVDAVCLVCTSLGVSRIDSCCGQSTSSACFDQFAPGNKTPASASATVTPTGSSAMATSSALRSSSTAKSSSTASGSANAGAMIKVNDISTGPVLVVVMVLIKLAM